MLDRDVVAVLMEHVPDQVRSLRDSIARMEGEGAGAVPEHFREAYRQVKELKDRCEQAGHSLTIALAGKVGTRRRLMRNRRDERRTCIMCGTEEVGTLATAFPVRFLLRRTEWKFDTLNGHISRTFTDPEWYFETLSLIRNFGFSTDVVLHHAFPPRLPLSFLDSRGKK
jgi:hypothetical protein